eukprot:5565419-Amphidinium_carterae.1
MHGMLEQSHCIGETNHKPLQSRQARQFTRLRHRTAIAPPRSAVWSGWEPVARDTYVKHYRTPGAIAAEDTSYG